MRYAEPVTTLPGLDFEASQACTLCKTAYPVSHFHRPGTGRHWGRCVNCRATDGTPLERKRQTARDTARRFNLKRLYNITVEAYDALRAAQDYRCAICGRHEDELPTSKVGRARVDGKPSAEPVKLQVDHDHETGANRKLLCASCNHGLGDFQERVDWLMRAIDYVRAHSASAA